MSRIPINLWLLEEEDGWTLVDAGLALDDIKRGWETLLAAHCAEKPASPASPSFMPFMRSVWRR